MKWNISKDTKDWEGKRREGKKTKRRNGGTAGPSQMVDRYRLASRGDNLIQTRPAVGGWSNPIPIPSDPIPIPSGGDPLRRRIGSSSPRGRPRDTQGLITTTAAAAPEIGHTGLSETATAEGPRFTVRGEQLRAEIEARSDRKNGDKTGQLQQSILFESEKRLPQSDTRLQQ